MVVNNLVFAQDLAKPVQVRYLPGSLYEYDNNGLQLTVALYQDGEPVNAAGTITGTVLRANGTTAVPAIGGTKSGNMASINIPSGALMPGVVRIVMKSTQNGVTTTLLAVTGSVVAIEGSAYIDPGSVIPDVSDMLTYADDINAAAATITNHLSFSNEPIAADRYRCIVTKT